MATVYRWDDSDAPVLDGQKGSLINLLDKVLVDGYGTKTAAGWTKAFVSANGNVAAYRNSPTNGLGFYYRVDDDAPHAGADYSSLVAGYETMSDVDTGAGPFPDSDGRWLRKSSSGDTVSRAWLSVADDQTIYLFVWNFTTGAPGADDCSTVLMMGDFLPIIPGDNYYAILNGMPDYYTFRIYQLWMDEHSAMASYYAVSPRRSTGEPGSINSSFLSTLVGGAPGFTADYAYPYHGQLLLEKYMVGENFPWSARGYMPGLYAPLHKKPLNNFDTYDDKIAINLWGHNSSAVYQIMIDPVHFRDFPCQ